MIWFTLYFIIAGLTLVINYRYGSQRSRADKFITWFMALIWPVWWPIVAYAAYQLKKEGLI